MSENPNVLTSIPEMGNKKVAVALSATGIYTRARLGPGTDSHYLKLFHAVCDMKCPHITPNQRVKLINPIDFCKYWEESKVSIIDI